MTVIVTDRQPSDKLMTERQSLGVAIKLIRLELRRMSFDRNAYHRYGARYAEAVRAHARSVELGRALVTLVTMKDKC